jgi:hypothetical protein
MELSPLRIVLYGIDGLLLFGALISLFCGAIGAAMGLGVWGALLFIGLVLERWRYKVVSDVSPGAGWAVTDERFVDPETGKTVTVYFNATTGERRYVGR